MADKEQQEGGRKVKKHRGLGRGLDALIPNAAEEESRDKENSPETGKEKADAENSARRTNTGEAEKNESGIIPGTTGRTGVFNTGKADAFNIEETASDPDQNSRIAVDDEPAEEENGLVRMVRLSLVEPDRNQPRKNFDKEKLQELADSIKAKGLLEPIIVQDKGGHYEIIAGERRWRACRLAELTEIPVIIKNYDDLEKVEISLIENIQREDLNPIEEANAYRRLIDEFHLKQDELAERVSRNRTSIANSMRLLKLCEKVQEMVADGRLSMGHARALIPVEDEETQFALAVKIVEEHLSVRDVEKLIRGLQRKAPRKKEKDPALELIYKDLENRMNAALGMKVAIKSQNEKSGRLEITYSSQDDLEKLMDKLMG